jgi:transcriptional regulator with XRE-family HTH domain
VSEAGGTSSAQEIGARIKRARLARNLTLKEVERKAEVSATHVSEIERGLTSPTVGALLRIAEALDTPACRFLESDERPRLSVVRESARLVLADSGGSARFLRLSEGVHGCDLSLFLIELAAGPHEPVGSLPHGGEGLFHVLRGVVELSGGGATAVLKEGDTFHGRGRRSIRNIGDGPATLVWAATPPLTL